MRLIRLKLAALRVAVVPPWEVWVNGRVDVVPICAGERVHVEAFLGDNTIGVIQVISVTDEVLQVTLLRGGTARWGGLASVRFAGSFIGTTARTWGQTGVNSTITSGCGG